MLKWNPTNRSLSLLSIISNQWLTSELSPHLNMMYKGNKFSFQVLIHLTSGFPSFRLVLIKENGLKLFGYQHSRTHGEPAIWSQLTSKFSWIFWWDLGKGLKKHHGIFDGFCLRRYHKMLTDAVAALEASVRTSVSANHFANSWSPCWWLILNGAKHPHLLRRNLLDFLLIGGGNADGLSKAQDHRELQEWLKQLDLFEVELRTGKMHVETSCSWPLLS